MKNKKIKLSILSTASVVTMVTSSTLTTSCQKVVKLEDVTNNPESVGFSSAKLQSLSDYIESKLHKVLQGTISKCYGFPSMQICATKDGKIFYNKAFGKALRYSQGDQYMIGLGEELPEDEQIDATTETLYDLASNTKMYAGMFTIQHLLDKGLIHSLDDPIYYYIPTFDKVQTGVWSNYPNDDPMQTATVDWKNITIKEILTHTSGFQASATEFLTGNSSNHKYPDGSYKMRDKTEIIEKVKMLDLQVVPGIRQQYSDIDFMLVDTLCHAITGKYIDQYAKENIYDKLGLSHTTFNPTKNGFTKDQCVATELVGNTREGQVGGYDDIRKTTIHGEVQDEVSYYTMGGVSGHAGLFSTASDLAILQNVMLNRGELDGVRLFSGDIVDYVTTPIIEPNPDTANYQYQFGIGWKVNKDNYNKYLFGQYASSSTYGHDGWTGTYTLIDPENKITISILTNAIHTILYDHSPSGTIFFGKHRYFLPEGTTGSYNYTGKVIAEKIYEAQQD